MDTTEDCKKTDRRVIKTKRAICNAFTDLLAEKDINEITIKDIADKADVNRKTVYNYYRGVYDILDEIENKIVGSFERVMSDFSFSKGFENLQTIFDSLNSVVNENPDFYKRLLKIHANAKLVDKLVSILKARLKTTLEGTNIFPKDKLDLVITYVVAGMLALYQHRSDSGQGQTMAEFSEEVRKLVLYGVSAFQNK